MRCFVALELPAQARAAAAEVLGDLKRSGADVKWVRPENLHVTLKFLGEVADERAPDLGQALETACAGQPALALGLAGAGAFPSPQRPQVVWLGLAGQVAELAGLAARIDKGLVGLGFAPESRPFQAHVTLGRLRRGKGGRPSAPSAPLTRALVGLAGLAGHAGPSFRAERVVLMKSTLTPQGSIYDPVQVITLA
jgi:RNA 2',3'-cyclic 3'-phosphodiesterase